MVDVTALPLNRKLCHIAAVMRIHASCAAIAGPTGHDAVVLLGTSGAGKSDMVLRLIQVGWVLVADDQVDVEGELASPPPSLAGLLEVRGLGLFRMPYLNSVPVRLVVRLSGLVERMPEPELDPCLHLPVIRLDPALGSAVARINMALEAACGRALQLAGAFAI